MIALLLWLQIESSLGRYPIYPVERAVPMTGVSRTYHGVTVAGLATTHFTHVSVCGLVTLVKREEDGDAHIRVSDGKTFIVAEAVPYHPMPLPKVGQFVRVAGISRIDKAHGSWAEIHPIEAIAVVTQCTTQPSGKHGRSTT